MPNPKDIKDVTWKTKDLETLFLISCYRERILLENAFRWKLKRQSYWRSDEERVFSIHFGDSGVTFTTMDREGEISTDAFELAEACDIPEIAEYVAEMNLALLQKHGWTAGLNEGVVLQCETSQAD